MWSGEAAETSQGIDRGSRLRGWNWVWVVRDGFLEEVTPKLSWKKYVTGKGRPMSPAVEVEQREHHLLRTEVDSKGTELILGRSENNRRPFFFVPFLQTWVETSAPPPSPVESGFSTLCCYSRVTGVTDRPSAQTRGWNGDLIKPSLS